ncbi:transglycosylase family protein [Macrococcoides bohemicum]|uniref:Transglycosylase family protein n=1 Tax=Macrococcoides bohemicum TaxID=1903056 RepID=A0AAJ4P9V7_9STAP|nr:transglycosylase family protein [Macrococcus bohemicus]QYA43373.1 transglycosylase family protein [Macrococcus bohemicus]
MKKALLTSSLALTLGVTGLSGVNGSHEAQASETTQTAKVDFNELANSARNNSETLNERPVHAGAYNYSFNKDGYSYNFESDGVYWTWEYKYTGAADTIVNKTSTQPQAVKQFDSVKEQTPIHKTTYQAPAKQFKQVSYQAPVQQKAPVQQSAYKAPVSQTSTSNVSVNAHLQLIAQRESGGNIRAINTTSGAAGKYQFLQSTWDTVAPASWKGKSPASAPESVQDAAAVKLYNEYGAQHWVTA